MWRSVLENSEDTHQKSELCSRCKRTTSERASRKDARNKGNLNIKAINGFVRYTNVCV